MIDMYSKTFGNGLETRRLYAVAFTGQNLPDHGTFIAVIERLRENANPFST